MYRGDQTMDRHGQNPAVHRAPAAALVVPPRGWPRVPWALLVDACVRERISNLWRRRRWGSAIAEAFCATVKWMPLPWQAV